MTMRLPDWESRIGIRNMRLSDAKSLGDACSKGILSSRQLELKQLRTNWHNAASVYSNAAVFRARDLLVRQRTQLINALRGQLTEYGSLPRALRMSPGL
jgi:hypothetical protein